MTTDLMTEAATIEGSLSARGWQRQAAHVWRLETPRGGALLEQTAFDDDWLRFTLRGPSVPCAKMAEILQRNALVPGPAKFIPRPKRAPVLRLDVPSDNTAWRTGARDWNEELHLRDPQDVWVESVSQLAGAEEDVPPADGLSDPDAVADEIGRCGWAATVDDGEIHIHFQMPGVFRQGRIERAEGISVKLAADLLLLDGLSDESRWAMTALAVEANARLPLVRFAEAANAAGRVLQAEIHFGTTLIPGAWLAASLEVLETAIALTARELEALRDPELAKLVVAANAV